MTQEHQALLNALQQDHEEVRSIFLRLRETVGEGERRELLDQLLRELLPHMIGEEQIVYPALRPDAQGWEDAEEAVRQHREAQEILQELREMAPDEAGFEDRVQAARQRVEVHLRDEEERIFADLQRILSERHAAQTLESFRREKDLARSRYREVALPTSREGGIRV